MAYFIFYENELYRLCKTDAEKNAQVDLTGCIEKSVDDTNFNAVLFNTKTVKLDNDNLVYTSTIVPPDPNPPAGKTINDDRYPNQGTLENYLNNSVKPILKEFLDSNPDNSMYSDVKSYYDYLTSLDLSTLTYPIADTWEKYCSDNSISYYHPLQIP